MNYEMKKSALRKGRAISAKSSNDAELMLQVSKYEINDDQPEPIGDGYELSLLCRMDGTEIVCTLEADAARELAQCLLVAANVVDRKNEELK